MTSTTNVVHERGLVTTCRRCYCHAGMRRGATARRSRAGRPVHLHEMRPRAAASKRHALQRGCLPAVWVANDERDGSLSGERRSTMAGADRSGPSDERQKARSARHSCDQLPRLGPIGWRCLPTATRAFSRRHKTSLRPVTDTRGRRLGDPEPVTSARHRVTVSPRLRVYFNGASLPRPLHPNKRPGIGSPSCYPRGASRGGAVSCAPPVSPSLPTLFGTSERVLGLALRPCRRL